MKSYEYYEDNGGGLHLFVMEGGSLIDGITNLEYAPAGEWLNVKDDMTNDPIKAVRTWDGHMAENNLDPEAFYFEIVTSEYGYRLVADSNGVYPARMGRAASRYFGTESN